MNFTIIVRKNSMNPTGVYQSHAKGLHGYIFKFNEMDKCCLKNLIKDIQKMTENHHT